MEKYTIVIEDNLSDIIEEVKDEVKQDFIAYLEENPKTDNFDNYYQNSGADKLHEISNSNTPIYTKDIDDLYYLYGSEFDEAYNNAGFGNGNEDNYKQVALYCYIYEKASDYLRELEELFNDRKSNKQLLKELKQ